MKSVFTGIVLFALAQSAFAQVDVITQGPSLVTDYDESQVPSLTSDEGPLYQTCVFQTENGLLGLSTLTFEEYRLNSLDYFEQGLNQHSLTFEEHRQNSLAFFKQGFDDIPFDGINCPKSDVVTNSPFITPNSDVLIGTCVGCSPDVSTRSSITNGDIRVERGGKVRIGTVTIK